MAHTNRRRGEHDEGPERARERARFSEFLQSARRAANLSLDEIETMTKLPARHLDALEQGRVAELPRGVYRRNILRTYASTVGLDPSLVVERFSQVYGMDAAFSEWSVPRAQARPPATESGRSTPAAPSQRPPSPAPSARALLPSTSSSPRQGLRIAAAAAALLLVLLAAYSLIRSDASPAVAPAADESDSAAPQQPANAPVPDGTAPAADGSAGPDSSGTSPGAVEPAGSTLPAEEVAPDPPLTDAQLVVTSNPPGARVTVDGIGWGVTPITIEHLSPGVKRVRLTLDGFVGVERDVRVGDEGGTVTVAATLTPRN